MDIDDKLDQILPKINIYFSEKDSMANENGYYIFDYDPEYEIKVRKKIKYLKDQAKKRNYDFKIVECDLFKMIIKILNSKGYLKRTFEFEKTKGKEYTYDKIRKVLKMSSNPNEIVKCIKKNTDDDSVVFITGVGKAYPIVRSHHVLKNLHLHLNNVPVILFFPGKYDEDDLILFKTINEGNYYRATKLIEGD